MKYLPITVAFFFFLTRASAQIFYPDVHDSSIIKIKGYYEGCGKVYNDASSKLLPSSVASGFTPIGKELLMAEQLMAQEYEGILKSDDRIKILIGSKYKEHFYKYYRQYIGFINKSGEKIVYIQLFKCCNGRINKCFPDWKKEIISPLSEDSCKITIRFLVNLSQGKISIP